MKTFAYSDHIVTYRCLNNLEYVLNIHHFNFEMLSIKHEKYTGRYSYNITIQMLINYRYLQQTGTYRYRY